MVLDYSTPGKVKVNMVNYIKSMVEEYSIEINRKVSSAAGENLFKITPSKRLSKMKAEVFHTFVAKALFLTKRAILEEQKKSPRDQLNPISCLLLEGPYSRSRLFNISILIYPIQ